MKTKDLTLTAMATALLIVCSQFSIPIGTVPITLQTLVVLLIAFNLKPLHAVLATSLYAIMGLIGLPVFAGWSGGFSSLTTPSFGFIISFIVASFVASTYLSKQHNRQVWHYVIAAVIATVIIYAIGIPYLAYVLNGMKNLGLPLDKILTIGMLPFLPGDTIKAALAIAISMRIPRQD